MESVAGDDTLSEGNDTGSFEWIDTLDEAQKIKFFGGKTKAALYDAGMLDRADYFKPLEDIDLSANFGYIRTPISGASGHKIGYIRTDISAASGQDIGYTRT